jgi:TPR repeat protein
MQQHREESSRTAAQYLGFMYEHGYGVDKDLKQAILCYTKAHENGVPLATYNIAVLYERGGEGVAKDYESALFNYKNADGQGVDNAAYRIGRIYERGGYGVAQDNGKALDWYQKALRQGVPGASNRILTMCLDGRAAEVNRKFAREYLTEAAKDGNHKAKVILEGIAFDALAQKN